MPSIEQQIAELRAKIAEFDDTIVKIEAAVIAQQPKPKPGNKEVDWDKTGAETEAYAKATGKWVEIRIFKDGTREGPEMPTGAVAPVPAPVPAPQPIPAPVGTETPAPAPVPVQPAPVPGDAVWSGIDKLRHRYGHTWEHDGQLDVSSWAGEGFQPSGAMQKPNEDGQGYGIYTMEMSGSKSNAPGKFACIWPKADKWYWEIDIVENDFNGMAIATLHWGAVKNDGTDGKDQQEMKYLDGIRADERHVYECVWSRDLIVIKVDGVEKARFTENVPRDASDGGPTDGLMGIGTQPAWAAQAQTGDQTFTLHSCSYRKLG